MGIPPRPLRALAACSRSGYGGRIGAAGHRGQVVIRPDPGARLRPQGRARRAFPLTYSVTQRDAIDRRSGMPTVDSVRREFFERLTPGVR